jgi:hypothetical protein
MEFATGTLFLHGFFLRKPHLGAAFFGGRMLLPAGFADGYRSLVLPMDTVRLRKLASRHQTPQHI